MFAASGVGLQPGLRTAPFQENGQTWAVVAYDSSPKVVPILAALRWDGSSWSSAWSAVVFNGWTGLPYKLTQLTLGHGVLGFGLNGVQFAGDDSPGAMMSNAGGKWQLIPFLLPIGTDTFGSGLQTTTLISPTFGPGGKATMDQVWDAGQCQEIQAFTYVVPREVFAPVGNLRDDFKSSFCKAYRRQENDGDRPPKRSHEAVPMPISLVSQASKSDQLIWNSRPQLTIMGP